MQSLTDLSLGNLDALASALASGRIDPADALLAVRRLVDDRHAAGVARELRGLADSGMRGEHIAHVVRAAATERRSRRALVDRLALVWTVGRQASIAPGRQTAAVVRQLFADAQERVLVTSYSADWIKDDEPEHHPFAVLAGRMDAMPELRVRVALNVPRKWGDETPTSELVGAFAQRFPTHIWPGARLPEAYFHPEGPEPFEKDAHGRVRDRACLHAKCVVVDGRVAFITSANFSDAAHERNVELGVRIDDPSIASAIEEEVDALIEARVLVRLALEER